ncbi:MAG: adventurous gliding motility lipoprotein CglB [Myxococcaceae bacterium]|nr:adventurous gliding motility lipoprotein CglB [Myxococcaceae bacterium]
MACQTYDFEPVEPLAISQTTQTRNVVGRQFKPDLMLLVDKSGSMAFPTNENNPNCPANCGSSTPCPSNCPTRISELRAAMNTFLSANGDVARMGLTIYPAPGGNSCSPSTSQEVLVPLNTTDDNAASLIATANQIAAKISTQQVNGGTPTASSLLFLGSLPELNDPLRQDFVLLLTDGLPNCNSANPNTCMNPTACKCTQSSCAMNSCTLGCLDRDASIAAVVNLKQRGIRTIVVGFGADLSSSGDGPTVLNAMAEAGGFPRACNNGDADCGGMPGSCDQTLKVCVQKFYQASNATDLAKALGDISASIGIEGICKYKLDATPSDPRFLSVLVDGIPTLSGNDTWKYVVGGTVELQGALCTRVTGATPQSPVKLEFRIVESI